MLRRKSLWRLGFVLALLILPLIAKPSCAEEWRRADVENRLAIGWSLLHDNSLYADRLPNWDACKATMLDGAVVFDESHADGAMAKLLGSVHDDYTFFRNRTQTAKYKQDCEARGLVQYALDSSKGIAYIKLRTFASKYTAEEMRDTLRNLEGCADSYVLDLRGNRGGLVQQAFAVFAMFVDEGHFAAFRGRNDGSDYLEAMMVTRTRLKRDFNGQLHMSRRTANLTAHKPVMVLVDGDTRSAAELLAGALHDAGRAQLVGSRTFGKGVVQDTWSLSDGSSIRITTGRSYLPKAGCIHGVGIQPDLAQLPDLSVISAK